MLPQARRIHVSVLPFVELDAIFELERSSPAIRCLATILITFLLSVPALSVELFRYRGAVMDGGTVEYVLRGLICGSLARRTSPQLRTFSATLAAPGALRHHKKRVHRFSVSGRRNNGKPLLESLTFIRP